MIILDAFRRELLIRQRLYKKGGGGGTGCAIGVSEPVWGVSQPLVFHSP